MATDTISITFILIALMFGSFEASIFVWFSGPYVLFSAKLHKSKLSKKISFPVGDVNTNTVYKSETRQLRLMAMSLFCRNLLEISQQKFRPEDCIR